MLSDNSLRCIPDIDECASAPCHNNGTCTDLVLDYNCSCTPGFTGKNCSLGRISFSFLINSMITAEMTMMILLLGFILQMPICGTYFPPVQIASMVMNQ